MLSSMTNFSTIFFYRDSLRREEEGKEASNTVTKMFVFYKEKSIYISYIDQAGEGVL